MIVHQSLNKVNLNPMTFLYRIILLVLLALPLLRAQPVATPNASQIQLALQKLNVLGSVLYVAAHPDDENTAVLAYLANERLLRTAYLSITRGEGGQNLLGKEQDALLGVLRTQELLAARRIDGAEQFFTRAIDFGYSKSAEETMRFWDEEALADVVWVIRYFKPDVIINRFSPQQGGHGHHLASAILAEEAFHAAADPERFTEQLVYVEPWQAKRLLWNTWQPNREKQDGGAAPIIEVDLGVYNPLLGQSYMEIAARSRTRHKSQGFGSSARRGSALNYFEHRLGEAAASDLFVGIDLTWNRVPGGKPIEKLIAGVIDQFNPSYPSRSISGLLEVYQALQRLPESHWIDHKKQEVAELIRQCAGLWLEAISPAHALTPGDTAAVIVQAINRSTYPFILDRIYWPTDKKSPTLAAPLEDNKPFTYQTTLTIPKDAELSQPFWLKHPLKNGSSQSIPQAWRHRAENPHDPAVGVALKAGGTTLYFSLPVLHRWTDPIRGELYRPLVIVPYVSMEPDRSVYVFADQKSKEVTITLRANRPAVSGKLTLNLPEGWRSTPQAVDFSLAQKGETKKLRFSLIPPAGESTGIISASADLGFRREGFSIREINYEHIPVQTVLQQAQSRLVRLDVHRTGHRLGYIMGSGDEIPQALEQIGYQVDLLSDEELATIDLAVYDAIICGIRAFNTRDQLPKLQKRLLDYVHKGGAWLVQHNTRFGIRPDDIGPYPFTIGRDRIAEEDASMLFINPDHPLLHFPNRITAADFDGWIQERGLYFASPWDDRYQTILAGADQNESVKEGALLYTRYGEGVFIYSGLSFFRQLPAGVPGAYRLFVNLIEAGKNGQD